MKKVGHTSEFPFGIYWWFLKILKNLNFENIKKIAGNIIIFYTCVARTSIIYGTFPEIQSETICFFLTYHSPPLPPPKKKKKKNLKKKKKKKKKCKKKKNIWRCHHVKLVLQKTRSNDVFLLKIRSATDILSFYVIFCCFTPLLTPEIKIGEKLKKHTKKKHLEMLSFYAGAP